jgi:hypothetical protein
MPRPICGSFRDEAERVVALMPAQQGDNPLARRQAGTSSRLARRKTTCRCPMCRSTACCWFMRSSVPNSSASCSAKSGASWQRAGVSSLVVPNRRGIWARLDHTPFGHGHPYTRRDRYRGCCGTTYFQPEQAVSGFFLSRPASSRIVFGVGPGHRKNRHPLVSVLWWAPVDSGSAKADLRRLGHRGRPANCTSAGSYVRVGRWQQAAARSAGLSSTYRPVFYIA